MDSGSWNESGDAGKESPQVPDAIFFKKPPKKLDASKFFLSKEEEDYPEDSSPPPDTAEDFDADRPLKAQDAGAAAGASSSKILEDSVFFKKPYKKLDPSNFFTTAESLSEEFEGLGEEAPTMEQSTQSLPPQAPSQDAERQSSSKLYLSNTYQGQSNDLSGSLDPTGRSTIMADNAKRLQAEHQGKKKTSLFDKGGAAATALAAVASILGSAVLTALLTPSEVIFTHHSENMYQYNYCYVSESKYRDNFCYAMRALYSFALVITLIFDILCLMATIIVAIGMSTWLALAYSFFILSIVFQTLAIIAAVWLAFPEPAAIGGSILLFIFLIAAGFFVLPGFALAWHFKTGVNKTLELDHTAMKRYPSIPKGSTQSKQEARVIEGTTVLHWAAYNGGFKHRLLLSVLLAAGEDVDVGAQGGGDGVTALMIAVLRGKNAVVKQLLAAGADVNRTEMSNERTALHYAAQKGHTDIVTLLLKAGANTTAVDLLGHSPINLARRTNRGEVVTIIQDFVQKRLDAELLHAAKRRKGERLRQLLTAGASPNSEDSRGTTALIWAANRGFLDGVSELLKKGAQVNAKNKQGSTALTEAALSGSSAVVRVLLDNNADPMVVVASDGSTALHRAARRGIPEVVQELLIRVQVDKQAVDEAALNKNNAALLALLNKAREGKYGMSLFQTAACIGSEPAVRLFLEKDALEVDQKHEVSALSIAAQEGHVDVVRTLLAGGAKTERGDAAGKTPLHWAACEGYASVVKELIKFKAQVDSVDYEGQTPLHAAAAAEKEKFLSSVEVAEVLIAGGANLNAVDSMGKRPVDIAKEKGNLKLLESFNKAKSDENFLSSPRDNNLFLV